MKLHFKAVRLDRTSHYDEWTEWRAGSVVRVYDPDPPALGPCGCGLHTSPTLQDAVSYQPGPSRYYSVEPLQPLAMDTTKTRSGAVRVIRELSKKEQDALAGFRLWEANHPIVPFDRKPRRVSERWLIDRVVEWEAVLLRVWGRDRLNLPVWRDRANSLWQIAGACALESEWEQLYRIVPMLVRDRLWQVLCRGAHYSGYSLPGNTVQEAVAAYVLWLLQTPEERLPVRGYVLDCLQPLLRLWYAGYCPVKVLAGWAIHAGPKAVMIGCVAETSSSREWVWS